MQSKLFCPAICSMVLAGLMLAHTAAADEQSIPPGVPEEGELSADSGPDGICNTAATGDDVQLVAVGSVQPNLAFINCGGDGVVGSTATGDDVQLRPLGSFCGASGVPILTTGPNGIPETTAGAGDNLIAGFTVGVAPPN